MSKKQAIQELLNRKTSNTENHFYREENIQEIGNTDKPESINTEQTQTDKKKATFHLNHDLHVELKVFAAKQNKKMVEVVEEALRRYMDVQ